MVTPRSRFARSSQAFAALGFMVSAVLISAAASEVVSILHMLGVVLSLSNTVLGLTLLAWGNSIGGDASVSGDPAARPHLALKPFDLPAQIASPTSPLRGRGTRGWRYPPASEASFSVSLFFKRRSRLAAATLPTAVLLDWRPCRHAVRRGLGVCGADDQNPLGRSGESEAPRAGFRKPGHSPFPLLSLKRRAC